MEAEIQRLVESVNQLESAIARQGRKIDDLESELYRMKQDLGRSQNEIRGLERCQRIG